jgi:hypothetical protein
MIPLLKRSYRYETHINLIRTDGTPLAADYPFTSGTVKEDRTANIRRSIDVEIPLWDYEDNKIDTVDTILDVTAVAGTGEFGDVIQLGRFRIDELKRTNRGAMRLAGTSFESYVVDARFPLPEYTPAGSNVKYELERLIADAMPPGINPTIYAANTPTGVDALTAITNGVVEQAVHWERDRWEAVKALAEGQACEIYVDRNGSFVVEQQLNLLHENNSNNPRNHPSSWEFLTGDEGMLIQLETTHTREGVYNGVLAAYRTTDEDQGGPGARPLYWYLAVHDEPGSRLNWGGPFGKKVKFYESSLLGSLDKCQAVAEAELTRSILPDRKYSVTGVGNPYLEAGDVVTVDLLDDAGLERFLVDSVSVPLSASGGWSVDLYSVEKKDYSDQ